MKPDSLKDLNEKGRLREDAKSMAKLTREQLLELEEREKTPKEKFFDVVFMLMPVVFALISLAEYTMLPDLNPNPMPYLYTGLLAIMLAAYVIAAIVGAVLYKKGNKKLLEAVNKEAARQNLRQDILLEVNIGEEAAKTGFAASEILPLIDKIDSFSNICVRGLMAIPPISENPGDNSKFFLKMREIYVDIRAKKKDNVQVDCLSMGMSGDYLDAIRCGSTMVRIGTAIFGERHY